MIEKLNTGVGKDLSEVESHLSRMTLERRSCFGKLAQTEPSVEVCGWMDREGQAGGRDDHVAHVCVGLCPAGTHWTGEEGN